MCGIMRAVWGLIRNNQGGLYMKSRRRLLGIILSLIMVISLINGLPLNVRAEGEHTHDGYTEWTSETSLPTASGSYYLSKDVTVTRRTSIPSGNVVNLCLNGHSITYTGTSRNPIYYINGTLNLYDCSDDPGMLTGGTGYPNSSNFSYGGAIFVNGGTFNMYGGQICENSANCGFGIWVNGGSLNIYGGSIHNNNHLDSLKSWTGAVEIIADDTATISSGIIEKNEGYGVITRGGTLNMTGGTIKENSNGGVCIYWGNKVDQSDIFYGSLNLSGGNIIDNGYCGIEYNNSKSGTFYLSGNPLISGNKYSDHDQNILIGSGKVINITGALDDTARCGIYGSSSYVFTTGLSGNGTFENFVCENSSNFAILDDGNGEALHEKKMTVSYSKRTTDAPASSAKITGSVPTDTNKYLPGESVTVLSQGTLTAPGYDFVGWNTTKYSYDDSTYKEGETFVIEKNSQYKQNLYGVWKVHHHEWTYALDELDPATIKATCGNSGGGHAGDNPASLTINAPTRTVFGGDGEAEATLTGAIDGVDTPIVYKNGDTVLDDAPINVGTYTANVTLGEVTAYVEYSIAKADAPTTLDDDQKPTPIAGISYTGSEFELINNPEVPLDGYTIMYCLDGEDWSVDIPKGENAGNYTIHVKYVGDSNHEDFFGEDIVGHIEKLHNLHLMLQHKVQLVRHLLL